MGWPWCSARPPGSEGLVAIGALYPRVWARARAGALATPPRIFRDLTIAECFGQQLDRPVGRFDAQCHRPKSADRCGNIAVALRGIGRLEAIDRRDLELQPVRIAKSDRWTRETREWAV